MLPGRLSMLGAYEGHAKQIPTVYAMRTFVLLTALSPAVVLTAPTKTSNKPPAFFLAGDSTTTINAGWGDGFLDTLKSPAWGINNGQSGATTLSYRQGGYWSNITAHVEEYAKEFDTYVTISVGRLLALLCPV